MKKVAQRRKAATSDVVGRLPESGKVPAEWKKHYRRLLELRDALLDQKGDLVQDANSEQPVYSLHMADAGTDAFDRDFALSRISSEQDALYEIEEALQRISSGSYGRCELTGKPIEARRLEAIPWTRFSAQAEKELEKHGQVRRARLAPRETMSTRAAADEREAERGGDESFEEE